MARAGAAHRRRVHARDIDGMIANWSSRLAAAATLLAYQPDIEAAKTVIAHLDWGLARELAPAAEPVRAPLGLRLPPSTAGREMQREFIKLAAADARQRLGADDTLDTRGFLTAIASLGFMERFALYRAGGERPGELDTGLLITA